MGSEESNSGRALRLPLTEKAIEVLKAQRGLHETLVFPHNGKWIALEGREWKRVLKKTEIEDFRWHDLRHTWASWHVMNGTSLQELMQLAG